MTDLQAWIATLDEDQRQTAIAAGLHKPPDDDPQFGRNAELREFDGLETCRKNGALHPIERSVDHRADDDEENEATPADPQLAAALRRILQWVVGNESAKSMFEHSKTLAVRIFILARCLRINNCDQPTLAEVAGIAGYSRAALSKVAVQMRDAFGVPNLTPQNREAHRGTARQAALDSWHRRKQK
jgi:hypothetical protein